MQDSKFGACGFFDDLWTDVVMNNKGMDRQVLEELASIVTDDRQ